MTIKPTGIWISLFAWLTGALPNTCLAADGPNLVTVDRLQAAYRAENIAQERYLAFAKQADEEGYKQVGSLFRTVARSKQILYTFHFDAIKELGGVPEGLLPRNLRSLPPRKTWRSHRTRRRLTNWMLTTPPTSKPPALKAAGLQPKFWSMPELWEPRTSGCSPSPRRIWSKSGTVPEATSFAVSPVLSRRHSMRGVALDPIGRK
jgi:hypothetical protein